MKRPVLAWLISACGASSSATWVPRVAPPEPSPTVATAEPPGLRELAAARSLPATLEGEARLFWARAFELGWADPRHGSPHQVSIGDSTVWRTELVERRSVGFLLDTPQNTSPFAVIEGTLYRAADPEPYDLGAACREALVALEEIDESDLRSRQDAWRGCPGPEAVLYLSTEDAPLAARIADVVFAGTTQSATHWLIGRVGDAFERAVTAHKRGDDSTAHYESHRVSTALPRLREWATSEGVEVARLDYLEVGVSLAADQDRRRESSVQVLPTLPPCDQVSDALVPTLILHLDQVQAPQMGQPGGVDFTMDPIVEALICAGDSAVPQLIETFEHDERLTRSVHVWRDFVPPRTVLAVYEAAYAALSTILGHAFFRAASTGDNLTSRDGERRAQLAQTLRQYWERFGTLSPARRRYVILSADDMHRNQQLEAARWLVASRDGFRPEGSTVFANIVPRGVPGPAMGEPLRNRHDPSISELLARRAEESGAGGAYGLGCGFAEALANWEPNAPSMLRAFVGQCAQEPTCYCASELVLLSADPQDGALLGRYASGFRRRSRIDARALEPLVRFSEHLTMQRAVDWLFNRGPWSTGLDARDYHLATQALLNSGATHVSKFRRYLHRWLRRMQVVGTYGRNSDGGSGWVNYRNGGFRVEGGLHDAAGESRIRAADVIAAAISQTIGIQFDLGWPRHRRDQAIAQMRVSLRQRMP